MNLLLLSAVLMLAIGSLLIKKSVPAVISFTLMMFLLGLYYMGLDAKLLGLFQIFIYTGGIIVLMLFGVTIIGVEFPHAKSRPYAAISAFLVFILLCILFFRGLETLSLVAHVKTEDINLFATSYSDFVLIFALIGSSLLYGTIKMSALLKAKGSTNV